MSVLKKGLLLFAWTTCRTFFIFKHFAKYHIRAGQYDIRLINEFFLWLRGGQEDIICVNIEAKHLAFPDTNLLLYIAGVKM